MMQPLYQRPPSNYRPLSNNRPPSGSAFGERKPSKQASAREDSRNSARKQSISQVEQNLLGKPASRPIPRINPKDI
jgi:hypothetical protein